MKVDRELNIKEDDPDDPNNKEKHRYMCQEPGCKNEISLTVGEDAFYTKKKLDLLRKCQDCHARLKAARND